MSLFGTSNLKSLCMQVKVRAPQQLVLFPERRAATFRYAMHIAGATSARLTHGAQQRRKVARHIGSNTPWWHGLDVDGITICEVEATTVELLVIICDTYDKESMIQVLQSESLQIARPNLELLTSDLAADVCPTIAPADRSDVRNKAP